MTRSAQAPVGGEPAACDVKQDMAISNANEVSTASKGPTLFTIPLEVRERIYEFASEETIDINSEWSIREKYINPGRNLLLVSRQIHDEARPFVYRTLTLNGYEPTSYLGRIANATNHWTYTRRVEIYSTCFCHAPIEDFDWGPADFPNHGKYMFWQDQWYNLLNLVENLPLVEDLCVNFDTCCRRTLQLPEYITGHCFTYWGRDPPPLIYSAMDHAELVTILGDRGFCVALERYFLRLLEDSTCVEKLTVRGDVPPSWLFHLLKPRQNGFKLKLHYMTEGLCDYIKSREALALAEEGPAPTLEPVHASELNTIKAPYPKAGVTNAILVKTNRNRRISLWEKNIGPEWSGMPMEGDYSFMEVLKENKSVDELEMSLDYTGSKSAVVPSSGMRWR